MNSPSPSPLTPPLSLPLHNGYGLARAEPDRDTLHLIAPDGRICLSIRLDPSGPVVSLSAASLQIATEGDLSVACERFQVNARRDIALVSDGHIAHDASGHVTTRADGEIVCEAAGIQHRARVGSVDITANDDITLDGERVILNGPKALPAPPVDLPKRTVRHEE